MAASNMNLIWVLVSQLCETQSLACSVDRDGTENIISTICI